MKNIFFTKSLSSTLFGIVRSSRLYAFLTENNKNYYLLMKDELY
jgi:hypothetical protein